MGKLPIINAPCHGRAKKMNNPISTTYNFIDPQKNCPYTLPPKPVINLNNYRIQKLCLNRGGKYDS